MESATIELGIGERCSLYSDWHYGRYYENRPARMSLSDEEKRRQRERDKKAFLNRFWPSYPWGQTWGREAYELQRLLEFLQRHHYCFGRPPANNRELEDVLKSAVKRESLIPVIERREYSGCFYIPPAQPVRTIPVDGLLEPAPTFSPTPSRALLSGEPILSGPYDPSTREDKLNVAQAAMKADANAGGPAIAITSTPLSDAQPFEYQSLNTGADFIDMAARGLTAADEAECDAMYEARMIYCNALSKMYGGDMRTYLACKDRAFQDYQACRGY